MQFFLGALTGAFICLVSIHFYKSEQRRDEEIRQILTEFLEEVESEERGS